MSSPLYQTRLSALELKHTTRHVFPVFASGSSGTTTGNSSNIHEPVRSSHGTAYAGNNESIGHEYKSGVLTRTKIGNPRLKVLRIATIMCSSRLSSMVRNGLYRLDMLKSMHFSLSIPNISILAPYKVEEISKFNSL
jgi:hypothetical protein